MSSLENKIAVITGASSGIGKEITLRLASEGMNLYLLGRNLSTLEEVAYLARKLSIKVTCYEVDLISDSELQSVIEFLKQDTHYIDVLIHSAGTISLGSIENASVHDFDEQFRVNVRAPFVLTQALLPKLKLRKGQVVFINSSSGLNASLHAGLYSATKFALKAIADSFRNEINTKGVMVLSVYPGQTATPMQENIFKVQNRQYLPELLLQTSDVAEIVASALLLPETAEVMDIQIRPSFKHS